MAFPRMVRVRQAFPRPRADQEEVPRARRAGGAGGGPREHGEDAQTDKPLFVANYYPNVWQLVVPASADIRKVTDLKGKAVALPPRGNTSLSEGWELVLRVNGMKLDDLGTKSYGSLTENAEAIRNRQAFAMGWTTTVPASFMLDLGTSMKLRMLSVPDANN